MKRRQALATLVALWPFAQDANAAQGKDTKLWTTDRSMFAMIESHNTLTYNLSAGTITITSKTRSVTVSIDEIIEALDPVKP